MDKLVLAAIAKWPDVPHCHGWLGLDARGQWRMRDQRCQDLNLPGDIIRHDGLLQFIVRNYLHDEHGAWYFQNGPQRVYVDLAAAPYIARTGAAGLTLHTGASMPAPQQAWITAEGQILLHSGEILALIDDRDLAEVMGWIRIDAQAVDDETLLAWLAGTVSANAELQIGSERLPLKLASLSACMQECGFIAQPRP